MSKHSNKNPTKKLIIILLSIILICSLVIVIKIKIDEHIDNKKQEEISQILNTIDVPTEDITLAVTERMLQVKELKEENNEVVGWLEIEGTNINYPVCQAEDNDYYLTHNYKKEKVSRRIIIFGQGLQFYKTK